MAIQDAYGAQWRTCHVALAGHRHNEWTSDARVCVCVDCLSRCFCHNTNQWQLCVCVLTVCHVVCVTAQTSDNCVCVCVLIVCHVVCVTTQTSDKCVCLCLCVDCLSRCFCHNTNQWQLCLRVCVLTVCHIVCFTTQTSDNCVCVCLQLLRVSLVHLRRMYHNVHINVLVSLCLYLTLSLTVCNRLTVSNKSFYTKTTHSMDFSSEL